MRVHVWSALPIAATVLLLLFGANPAPATAKNDFTYFAEAFNLSNTDANGLETTVSLQAVDRLKAADEVSLSISRVNPACADPEAGCPYVLFRGLVLAPVAEGDVRIQPNLNWARVATTITFVDTISGGSCPAMINVLWQATGDFAADGDNGQGFRKADASGTISCAGEEFIGGQVDSSAEISRFILPT